MKIFLVAQVDHTFGLLGVVLHEIKDLQHEQLLQEQK
jgi:hypothetical protein